MVKRVAVNLWIENGNPQCAVFRTLNQARKARESLGVSCYPRHTAWFLVEGAPEDDVTTCSGCQQRDKIYQDLYQKFSDQVSENKELEEMLGAYQDDDVIGATGKEYDDALAEIEKLKTRVRCIGDELTRQIEENGELRGQHDKLKREHDKLKRSFHRAVELAEENSRPRERDESDGAYVTSFISALLCKLGSAEEMVQSLERLSRYVPQEEGSCLRDPYAGEEGWVLHWKEVLPILGNYKNSMVRTVRPKRTLADIYASEETLKVHEYTCPRCDLSAEDAKVVGWLDKPMDGYQQSHALNELETQAKQEGKAKACEVCGEQRELKVGMCFQCLAAAFEDSERDLKEAKATGSTSNKIEQAVMILIDAFRGHPC
jgi:hypothetical protein